MGFTEIIGACAALWILMRPYLKVRVKARVTIAINEDKHNEE